MCRSSASDTLDSVLLLGVGSSSEKEEEEEVVEVAEGKKVMLVMVFDHRVKKMMAFLGWATDWIWLWLNQFHPR
jgi:hypothetical protein